MIPNIEDFSGFITGIAVVFISGEMAGIGMLATPWAVVNLGKSLIGSYNCTIYHNMFHVDNFIVIISNDS